MAITKMLLNKYSSVDKFFVFFSKLLFFITVFITSCTFHSSLKQEFLFSNNYAVLKLFLSFLIPAVSTAFCFYATKNFNFIGKATSVTMILFIFLNEFDFSFFKNTNKSNLYHLACGILTFFTIFFVSCALFYRSKNKHIKYFGFNNFYNEFFKIYLFLFIYLFFTAFLLHRQVSNLRVVNLIPFNGEIKDAINVIFEKDGNWIIKTIRTIGNIFFFTTMPLLLSRFINKNKIFLITIIPILTSFLAELIQGLTKIGDADIDDIILNTLGTIFGVLIYKYIIKKLLLEEQKCLEL